MIPFKQFCKVSPLLEKVKPKAKRVKPKKIRLAKKPPWMSAENWRGMNPCKHLWDKPKAKDADNKETPPPVEKHPKVY